MKSEPLNVRKSIRVLVGSIAIVGGLAAALIGIAVAAGIMAQPAGTRTWLMVVPAAAISAGLLWTGFRLLIPESTSPRLMLGLFALTCMLVALLILLLLQPAGTLVIVGLVLAAAGVRIAVSPRAPNRTPNEARVPAQSAAPSNTTDSTPDRAASARED